MDGPVTALQQQQQQHLTPGVVVRPPRTSSRQFSADLRKKSEELVHSHTDTSSPRRPRSPSHRLTPSTDVGTEDAGSRPRTRSRPRSRAVNPYHANTSVDLRPSAAGHSPQTSISKRRNAPEHLNLDGVTKKAVDQPSSQKTSSRSATQAADSSDGVAGIALRPDPTSADTHESLHTPPVPSEAATNLNETVVKQRQVRKSASTPGLRAEKSRSRNPQSSVLTPLLMPIGSRNRVSSAKTSPSHSPSRNASSNSTLDSPHTALTASSSGERKGSLGKSKPGQQSPIWTAVGGRDNDEDFSVDDYISLYANGFATPPLTALPNMDYKPARGSPLSSPPIARVADKSVQSMVSLLRERTPTDSTMASLATPTWAAGFRRTSRDRYGFKKESLHVSIDQHDEWELSYRQYLARRRAKWHTLMKSHGLPTQHPTKFPPCSDKVRRFVRKGIPPEWRGQAWFWYCDGPARMERCPELYRQLIERVNSGELSESDRETIERDLNRTFPDNVKFKPEQEASETSIQQSGPPSEADPQLETTAIQALRRVLQAFAVHYPEVGYCQSLNFLAGLLLLFLDNNEEQAFHMLCILTTEYLPGTHGMALEGANVDIAVLMSALRDTMPGLYARLDDSSSASDVAAQRTSSTMLGSRIGTIRGKKTPPPSPGLPTVSLSTTAWFMSCFVGVLPIETCCRVWDVLFYEGSKTLFRVALGVFKLGEPQIRALKDPLEVFQVVQNLPRKMVDANALMEAAFGGKTMEGRGLLSQESVEKRRSERRALNQRERAKLLAPPSLADAGQTRPATSDGTESPARSPTLEALPVPDRQKLSPTTITTKSSVKKFSRFKSLRGQKKDPLEEQPPTPVLA